MFPRLIRLFWSDLSADEIKKFGLLSLAFFFVVGPYWLLKPLKDGFFFKVVGKSMQPTAKIVSVIVVALLVIVYSRLIDIFEKHQLFYIIGSFFAFIFGVIALFIFLRNNGLFINSFLVKAVAWVSFMSIESFGSIVVALFWSFVASITDSSSAKRGYPLIITVGQVGAVIGSLFAFQAQICGLPLLFCIVGFSIVVLMFIIRCFMKVVGNNLQWKEKYTHQENKHPTGFLEGLKLLLSRPYLFGIFLIVASYEIVGTIVDYQMKSQASDIYVSEEAMTSFLGVFGIATNGLAFFMAALGVAYFMKRFGLTFCLLAFPVSLGIAVSGLYNLVVSGVTSPQALLWTIFGVMTIAKGLSYALNNPAKEIMYIPTSKDAKFKSKGWIDVFGARSAKAAGSTFNEFLRHSSNILLCGTVVSLGLIVGWVLVALFVSDKFNRLVRDGRIVG